MRRRRISPALQNEDMTWRVVLEQDKETGEWTAWCPELPGCTSAGDTQDEATQNIKEAIELYLEPSPVRIDPDAIVLKLAV